MFNIHAIIILIRSIFHALDKYKIHQIQSCVLLKISQDASKLDYNDLCNRVAYIHKEPPPVVGRTHIYGLLQLETVCILVRYSNTLTFSAHSNELVT